MNENDSNKQDHLRKNTAEKVNEQIEQQIKENITRYSHDPIQNRIDILKKEWDI